VIKIISNGKGVSDSKHQYVSYCEQKEIMIGMESMRGFRGVRLNFFLGWVLTQGLMFASCVLLLEPFPWSFSALVIFQIKLLDVGPVQPGILLPMPPEYPRL
jgi:hypothetical protein